MRVRKLFKFLILTIFLIFNFYTISLILSPINEKHYDLSSKKYPVIHEQCPFEIKSIPFINVRTLELLKDLKFDNRNGEDFNVKYDIKQWDKHNKLKVSILIKY